MIRKEINASVDLQDSWFNRGENSKLRFVVTTFERRDKDIGHVRFDLSDDIVNHVIRDGHWILFLLAFQPVDFR